MSETALASIESWLAAPLGSEVSAAIERLRRAPDIQRVAVMPDVHLAADVCVGLAVATSHLIYPQAVGGDIGCGVFAVELDHVDSSSLRDPRVAGRILTELGRAIPPRRRNRRAVIEQPSELAADALSNGALESVRANDGATQFATLGSGNHFLEIQADQQERLWLMIHSGSRALGQAIRDYHLGRANRVGAGLFALDARSDDGVAYLRDADHARRYAAASRRAIAEKAGHVLFEALGATVLWQTSISTDHNHVSLERIGGRNGTSFRVHRKGAMPARLDEPGVIPGSMGSSSFHVAGRGNEAALCSSAHGAGRALSRTAARARFTPRDLHRQMEGIWYDYRIAGKLRDEAPAAYKDVRAVLRAQKDLVRITRTLRPLLNYKGA